MPHATHVGELTIGGVNIACAVPDDGRRVLGQQAVFAAIGRTGRPHGERNHDIRSGSNLPDFLAAENLKPYVLQQKLHAPTSPIRYRTTAGRTAYGYRVLTTTVLVYTRAFWANALRPNQVPIACNCAKLQEAFAEIGAGNGTRMGTPPIMLPALARC